MTTTDPHATIARVRSATEDLARSRDALREVIAQADPETQTLSLYAWSEALDTATKAIRLALDGAA